MAQTQALVYFDCARKFTHSIRVKLLLGSNLNLLVYPFMNFMKISLIFTGKI